MRHAPRRQAPSRLCEREGHRQGGLRQELHREGDHDDKGKPAQRQRSVAEVQGMTTFFRCTAHIGTHEMPSSRNPAKHYTVTFNAGPDKLGNEVWCDCPAWRMQKGARHGEDRNQCKHIEQVFNEMCGWDQSVHGQHPVHKNDPKKGIVLVCPVCGGPVQAFDTKEDV